MLISQHPALLVNKYWIVFSCFGSCSLYCMILVLCSFRKYVQYLAVSSNSLKERLMLKKYNVNLCALFKNVNSLRSNL